MKFLLLCLQADTNHAEQRQNVNINMFDHGRALRAVLPTLGGGGESRRGHACEHNSTGSMSKPPFMRG